MLPTRLMRGDSGFRMYVFRGLGGQRGFRRLGHKVWIRPFRISQFRASVGISRFTARKADNLRAVVFRVFGVASGAAVCSVLTGSGRMWFGSYGLSEKRSGFGHAAVQCFGVGLGSGLRISTWS